MTNEIKLVDCKENKTRLNRSFLIASTQLKTKRWLIFLFTMFTDYYSFVFCLFYHVLDSSFIIICWETTSLSRVQCVRSEMIFYSQSVFLYSRNVFMYSKKCFSICILNLLKDYCDYILFVVKSFLNKYTWYYIQYIKYVWQKYWTNLMNL